MPIRYATSWLPIVDADTMRITLVLLVATIVISLAIDAYLYSAARKRLRSNVPARIQLVSALILYCVLAAGLLLPIRSGDSGMFIIKMWLLFGYMTFVAGKLVFIIFDLLASIPKIFGGRRLKWLSVLGGVFGVVTFLAMWWGALTEYHTSLQSS